VTSPVGCVRLAIVFALALLLRAAAADAQAQPQIQIKELTIEGNRRVQEAVIAGRIKSKLGGPFSPSQLSEDVRSVFGLGFFDDVQLRVEDFEGGVKVTFVVTERPFLRDIEFAGNEKISSSELLEKIDLRLGGVYSPVDVQRAVEKIRDAYEDDGYFEVQVAPAVEKFSDGDVKVVFRVTEGRRMTIDQITITGNKGLTAEQIKGALETKERQYFVLRGTVQRQRLDVDIERIIALYNNHGYIQARVESHDFTVDRARARVTISIAVVEGPQYRIGEITFTGITLVPEPEVRRQLRIKTGDVFSRLALANSVDGVKALYSTIGRASADVGPRTEQTAELKVNVVFEINEGPEVYVERINIAGNTRSQDKILRREIPMVEGDLFTLQKLNRARQRLVNLGYFDKVDVGTQPGSSRNKIVINVDVTERPTGLFSIGGGYSSVDSFVGTIDLVQNNFLGRGLQVAFRIRAGGTSQHGTIGITDPWFLDTPLSAGFDLYKQFRQYTEYDYETLGGGPRVSYPFWDYWRWHVGYRLSQDKIDNVQAQAESLLGDQVGTTITSMISTSLTRDSRDNTATPTSGGQTTLAVDVAGLGGDNKYFKAIVSQSYFRPIWFGHILSGRVEFGVGAGFGDEDLPAFERFYLGGPNSVRGWKYRQISPIDDAGQKVGGTSEVLGNIEYIIPLPFGLRLAAFLDVGNAYGFGTTVSDGVKWAAGAGVRWNSPFGPLRLDYGFKLNPEKGEDIGAIQFSVGSPF
jgi:outer membrane protein insertion porin family